VKVVKEKESAMLFVTVGREKAGSTTKSRVARRVNWKYPQGVRVLGEYWLLSSDPALIMIAESENVASLMMGLAEWDDLLDMTIMPALSSEQGLELAKQMGAAS
jgi:hypothetical protein